MQQPLAIKLRPTELSEVIGQKHLIGKDKILTNLVKNKKLFSMILYGKPGIGKTSIALALVNELGLKYRILNATINNKANFWSDKNEDGYYEVLSAFQKSIRGSDVDASIHYLARLIAAEDIEAIARRLSVIAYEDIGLANPSIGPKLDAAINAALRVGFPEARIPLSEIVIEMALSPKSNSAVMAIDEALSDIQRGNTGNVPKHLKNPSKDYLYPHNYKNSYVKQQYLPDNIKDKQYYHPKNNKNEKILKEINDNLKKL